MHSWDFSSPLHLPQWDNSNSSETENSSFFGATMFAYLNWVWSNMSPNRAQPEQTQREKDTAKAQLRCNEPRGFFSVYTIYTKQLWLHNEQWTRTGVTCRERIVLHIKGFLILSTGDYLSLYQVSPQNLHKSPINSSPPCSWWPTIKPPLLQLKHLSAQSCAAEMRRPCNNGAYHVFCRFHVSAIWAYQYMNRISIKLY